LGLKQAAMAELLQISQAYYSRLEAGRHDPSNALQCRIQTLLDTHTYRSTFDQCRLAVRYSPVIAGILQNDEGVVRIVECSKGARALGGYYASLERGDSIENLFGLDADTHLEAFKRLGLFDGRVSVVETVWCDPAAQHHQYFQGTCSSLRDDMGVWCVQTHNKPIGREEYKQMQVAGAGLRVLAA